MISPHAVNARQARWTNPIASLEWCQARFVCARCPPVHQMSLCHQTMRVDHNFDPTSNRTKTSHHYKHVKLFEDITSFKNASNHTKTHWVSSKRSSEVWNPLKISLSPSSGATLRTCCIYRRVAILHGALGSTYRPSACKRISGCGWQEFPITSNAGMHACQTLIQLMNGSRPVDHLLNFFTSSMPSKQVNT